MSKANSQNNRDALLVRATSDAASFSLLCNIYYKKIFSYILSRLCARQIALDVTSAVFVFASQHASTFRGGSRTDFLNWLYRIAAERVDIYLKKKDSRKNLSKFILGISSQQAKDKLIPLPLLYGAILALSPRQQNIACLIFFEKLSPPQASEIVGISAERIRIELAEILGRLKKIIITSLPSDCGDVFESRQKFEEIIDRFEINKEPDLGHAERLRSKIILSFNRPDKNIHIMLWLTAVTVIIVAGFAIFYFTKDKSISPKAEQIVLPDTTEINQPVWPANQSRLEKIKTLAAEKNTAELLSILETGDLPSRLLAARFLSEIIDANVSELLKIATQPTETEKQSLPTEAVAKAEDKTIIFADLQEANLIEVGGIIQDGQFLPVENAQVNVRYIYQADTININEPFFTDANGEWICNVFPDSAEAAELMISHSNYIQQDNYQPAVLERLRDFSYLTILEAGVRITGKVIDRQNRPLPAVVNIGLKPKSNIANCNAEGVFVFDNVPVGTGLFTIQSSSTAPHIEQIEIGPNTTPLVFTLQEPNTIRCRVIDSNGAALEDVNVAVDFWQGFGSLDFNIRTDANGFFEWNSAPADEVFFRFDKPGYITVEDFGIESSNDYVITLLRQN